MVDNNDIYAELRMFGNDAPVEEEVVSQNVIEEPIPSQEEIEQMPDLLEELGLSPKYQPEPEGYVEPEKGSSYLDIAKSTGKTFLPSIASSMLKAGRFAGETTGRATGIIDPEGMVTQDKPAKPQAVLDIEAQLEAEGREVPETVVKSLSRQATDFIDAYTRKEQEALDLNTSGKRLTNDILNSTANMVPYIVGGVVTGNPALALGGMSAQVVGEKYGELEDDDRFTQGQKLGIALGHGAITYITEKLPMDFMFKKFGKGFVRNALGYTLREVPQEMAEGALQDALDIATTNPELTGREVLDRALQTILPTIGTSLLLGGGVSGVNRIIRRFESQQTGEVSPQEEAESTHIEDVLNAVEKDPEGVVPTLTDEELAGIDALRLADQEGLEDEFFRRKFEEAVEKPIKEESDTPITDQIVPEQEKILTEQENLELEEIAPKIPTQEDEQLSGIAKTLIPEETAKDFPEQRTTLQAELDKGEQLVKDGDIRPEFLMDEILKKPRALQPNETSALVYYKRTLDNDFDNTFDKFEEARITGDKVKQDEMQQRLDVINSLKDKFFEVSDSTGYQQGLSLGLRAMMLDSEYNLRTKINEYKAFNNGVIEPDVEARFQQYDNELQTAKKQIRDLESQLSQQEEVQMMEGVRREIEKEDIKDRRLKGRDLIADGVDELITALGGKKSFIGDVNPKITSALAKIGRGLIDEGIATIDNVNQKIKEYLQENNINIEGVDRYSENISEDINKETGIKTDKDGNIVIPPKLIRDYVEQGVDSVDELTTSIKEDFNLDLSEREIRDQITQYGKQVGLSQDDISKKVRELKRTGRVMSAIEDVVEDKKPLKSGVKKDELTEREIALKKHLKELIKDTTFAEEERLDRLKTNIKKQIEEYERRLKENDFVEREKTTFPFEEEMGLLEAKKEEVKKKYDIEIERLKRKNRNKYEKAEDIFVDVMSLPKSLKATADFSAPLRQGLVLGVNNPLEASKAFKDMFKFAFSEKKYNEYLNKIKTTPEWAKMKQSGLFVAEPTVKMSAKEEEFISNLAEKIPFYGKFVVKPSERAYGGYLNKLRIDVFNKYSEQMEDAGYTFESNPEIFKGVASLINNATGRGGLGKLESVAPLLNAVFWSPRYVTSRVGLAKMALDPTIPAPVRKLARKNLLTYLGLLGMTLSLFKFAGADVEEDARSSDFAKIRTGKVRRDLGVGYGQQAVLLARLLTGQTKDANGIIKNIDNKTFPFNSRLSVLGRFLRSKLSPSAGLATDFLAGETFDKRDFNLGEQLLELPVPLSLQEILDAFKEEEIPKALVDITGAIFGMGLQIHETKGAAKKAVENDLPLKEMLKAVENAEGELTSRKRNKLIKQYKAYKKYGIDSKDLGVLLRDGMSNKEKALYMVSKNMEKSDALTYLRDKVISKALYRKYREFTKKRGKR